MVPGGSTNFGSLVRVEPSAVGVPDAQCLDGSGPVYFHRPAQAGGSGAGKWLLYFQGGGWCVPGTGAHAPFPPTLVDRCGQRSADSLGSTRSDHKVKNFSFKPLFSRDPEENPMFHNWHTVFLRYCDGASFADVKGGANFQAILRGLLTVGLSNATDVVISGCSAGAVAAALHSGTVQRVLPHAFVAALLDSGVFPDWSRPEPGSVRGRPHVAVLGPPPGIWPLDAELRRAFEERGLAQAGVVPTVCLERHPGNAWRCLFLEYLLPFVGVPAFVLQSRFDSSNVRGLGDPAGLEALGVGIAWRLEAALEAHSQHGLFLDSCFHHCMTWGDIKDEAGLSQPAAFLAWWQRARALAATGGAAQVSAAASEGLMRWEYRSGNGSGPCLDRGCCAHAQAHLDFWTTSFSEAAAAASAKRRQHRSFQ